MVSAFFFDFLLGPLSNVDESHIFQAVMARSTQKISQLYVNRIS